MRAKQFIRENANTQRNVTIYVDMDGVIVDLYNHIGKMLGVDYSTLTGDQWENFYQNVDAYKLFRTAPMFPTAFTLLSLVKNNSNKYQILSTPLSYHVKECIRAKKEWLAKYAPEWADNPIFTDKKEQYAVTDGIPNILIDDSPSVIRKWEAAGGIAIRYKADADDIQTVVNGIKSAKQVIDKLIADKQSDEKIGEDTSKENNYSEVVQMFEKFLPLAMQYIDIDQLPKMHFAPELSTGNQPSFGMYIPDDGLLAVALANRHPVDILRTVAHELVHYKQHMNGELNPNSGETGSPHENEANSVAGIIMRAFNKKYPAYLKIKPVLENFYHKDDEENYDRPENTEAEAERVLRLMRANQPKPPSPYKGIIVRKIKVGSTGNPVPDDMKDFVKRHVKKSKDGGFFVYQYDPNFYRRTRLGSFDQVWNKLKHYYTDS